MSLVYAALTPHPPIIIPTIGKSETLKVKKTIASLKKIEEELYLAKPNYLIIISPHGSLFEQAFTVNANTKYISDFEQFGDHSTKKEWQGIPELATQIIQQSYAEKIPVQTISQEKIDHGSSVPLYYITEHIDNIKILPIGFSGLDNKTHLKFGELIKEIILESNKRVAVIASGDMSHALTDEAPAGFSPAGIEFDKKIISLLETRNTAGIINLEKKFVADAKECGYRSLLILLGILKEMDFDFSNYSYEAPFGVGYLTGNFVF